MDHNGAMPSYVAFLRAINLGPTRKFPKAEIIAATEAAGGTDVATHINTGNVRLTTSLRSRARVEAALEAAYQERTGFVVPTIAFTFAELVAIAADARELTASRPDLERHYVYLLKDVLHDWDVPACRLLLRRCAEAVTRAPAEHPARVGRIAPP